jgi:transcription-repair coupling factor (superfamily II helicase)
MIGEQDVLFYPGSYRRPYQIEDTDNANVLLRAEVLNRINSRKKPAVIVSYPEALFEKVVTRKDLDKNTLKCLLAIKFLLISSMRFYSNMNSKESILLLSLVSFRFVEV